MLFPISPFARLSTSCNVNHPETPGYEVWAEWFYDVIYIAMIAYRLRRKITKGNEILLCIYENIVTW